MNRQKKYSFALIAICILLVAGAATAVVSAQQGKVVSSYGPTNQAVTFDQIKAARMAVKVERAKKHIELLNSRYDLSRFLGSFLGSGLVSWRAQLRVAHSNG